MSHTWSIRARSLALSAVVLFGAGCASTSQTRVAEPVKVKVFVGAMFEIGQNTGDRAGEFQYWYERYWKGATPITVPGALQPVYCNTDGVCGAVLGMGKVNSSSSMQAILQNPRFDFSKAYLRDLGRGRHAAVARHDRRGELGHLGGGL